MTLKSLSAEKKFTIMTTSSLRSFAIALSVVALVFVATNSVRAALVSVGDPQETGSWAQAFNESGVGSFARMEAIMRGSEGAFESPGFSAFSSSWSALPGSNTHIIAAGDSLASLNFNISFAGSSSAPLTFDFYAWNGASLVDWTTVYYLQPNMGSVQDPNSTYWWYDIHNPSEYIPVPEPTTMIAGALLLLPFGVSTLRILRKKRAA